MTARVRISPRSAAVGYASSRNFDPSHWHTNLRCHDPFDRDSRVPNDRVLNKRIALELREARRIGLSSPLSKNLNGEIIAGLVTSVRSHRSKRKEHVFISVEAPVADQRIPPLVFQNLALTAAFRGECQQVTVKAIGRGRVL